MNRDVIKSVAASYVPRFVEFLTGPVSFIVITKSLDRASYGSYHIILNMVCLSMPILTFGLAKYLHYAIPGEKIENQYRYFTNVLLTEVLLYVCAVMVILFPFRNYLARLLKFPLSPHWLWGAPLLWTGFIVEQRILLFLGLKKRLKLKALLSTIEQILYVLLLLGVFVWSVRVGRIVAARIISYFIILAISLFFLKKRHLARSRPDRALILDAVKYSMPLILVDTSLVVIQTIDRFMLSSIYSVNEVGLYSYGFQFLLMSYYLGSPLLWAMYPYFAESYRLKKKDKNRIFFFQFSLTLVICAITSSGLVADRGILVPLVSRKEYLEAGFTFNILLLYPVGISAMYMYQQILLLEKDTKIIGIIFAASAVGNIILNALLIPRYAEKGAALASIIAIWFMTAFFYNRCRRYDISLFNGWIARFLLFWVSWFGFLFLTRPLVTNVFRLCIIHTFAVIPLLLLFRVLNFKDLFRMIKTKGQMENQISGSDEE